MVPKNPCNASHMHVVGLICPKNACYPMLLSVVLFLPLVRVGNRQFIPHLQGGLAEWLSRDAFIFLNTIVKSITYN